MTYPYGGFHLASLMFFFFPGIKDLHLFICLWLSGWHWSQTFFSSTEQQHYQLCNSCQASTKTLFFFFSFCFSSSQRTHSIKETGDRRQTTNERTNGSVAPPFWTTNSFVTDAGSETNISLSRSRGNKRTQTTEWSCSISPSFSPTTENYCRSVRIAIRLPRSHCHTTPLHSGATLEGPAANFLDRSSDWLTDWLTVGQTGPNAR